MTPLPEQIDWSPDEIKKEIREREELRKQMVGTLYPGIVWDEIIRLRKAYISITGRFDY